MRRSSLVPLLGAVALAGVVASISCKSEPSGPPPVTDVPGAVEIQEEIFEYQCECYAQFFDQTVDECLAEPTATFDADEIACLEGVFEDAPDAFQALRCETEALRGLLECDREAGCPGTFTCSDGVEIAETWLCDGIVDCADEGDEGEVCLTEMCADGEMIRPEDLCDDFPDCSDGSDETGCPPLFRCGDGQEIPGVWVCDNRVDCPDGADERQDCPETCERGWLLRLAECEEFDEDVAMAVNGCLEFVCLDGTVLESSQQCDGTPDCTEAEDESFCDGGSEGG